MSSKTGFRCGEGRNRPLEAAKRIAEAAVRDLGGQGGPPSKRLRLMEGVEEENRGGGKRKRKEEEEGRNGKPSISMDVRNDREGENGQNMAGVDDNGNEEDGEDCYDVEVAGLTRLEGRGQAALVQARLICGTRVAGRKARVAAHPMVEEGRGWEVVGGTVGVGAGGKVVVRVVSRGAVEVREGELLAQAWT